MSTQAERTAFLAERAKVGKESTGYLAPELWAFELVLAVRAREAAVPRAMAGDANAQDDVAYSTGRANALVEAIEVALGGPVASSPLNPAVTAGEEKLTSVDPRRERLAALEHEQWAHWTRHMLHVMGPIIRAAVAGEFALRGEAIPETPMEPNPGRLADLCTERMKDVRRWRKQLRTAYADLTEAEKNSDRGWADKVLALLEGENDERSARPGAPLEHLMRAGRKPDEIELMREALSHPLGTPAKDWANIPAMHEKRRFYLLAKWESKGWMDATGWSGDYFRLTELGREAIHHILSAGS